MSFNNSHIEVIWHLVSRACSRSACSNSKCVHHTFGCWLYLWSSKSHRSVNITPHVAQT